MKKKSIKILFSALTFIVLFSAIVTLTESVYATTDCSGHNTITCYDYAY